MDRLGLWSIPFVIVFVAAGEFSRKVFTPLLRSIQPGWPDWLVTFISPLPGLVLVGAIGYWLFLRLDPSRRSRP